MALLSDQIPKAGQGKMGSRVTGCSERVPPVVAEGAMTTAEAVLDGVIRAGLLKMKRDGEITSLADGTYRAVE